ncbi:3-deoxy-7-phosphoheptulonate synthase [Actinoplanes bogorensis]|uniref:Phospho-2-dehydro-3-deoxyheptonate aldolase n=1 Tax=Paractinoplanes bogorensis TaxID=1610840 RepID=A0ABS5YKC1_9ACTN|nr:3-deoxy-7-phosphoheptulonate synthase [Actinoplanes bogorensis]MBU2663848.1 3-deoxy-7-phosphoheptulonate synthase [Actinoplanes bogorensis]
MFTVADLEERWESLPAREQPAWSDHPSLSRMRTELRFREPLVTESEIEAARAGIARVATGDALLLQAGDCAESFDESGPSVTAAKAAVIGDLADSLTLSTGQPVMRFGRMAGQYAKPRSSATETVAGIEMPTFRGHIVNSPAPHPAARVPDPERLLQAYDHSARVLAGLRGSLWVSHEALLLDYEGPQVRRGAGLYLASTHLPWIGERTRQADHAHVAMLAAVTNPVACKVGPTASPESVVDLCERLDPHREPGRLTLIARMGAGRVAEALPPIARAVRRAGHPVVWLSDPMHGNTVRAKSGEKTRHLDSMIAEAGLFRAALEGLGLHPGGLHLEVAAADVTECVGAGVAEDELGRRYESLCDPRLNPVQARTLIETVF